VKLIYTTVASASLIASLGLSATAHAASFDESLINNQFLLDVLNRNSLENTVSDATAEQLQITLDQVRDDIPGAFLGIINPERTWVGVSGVSNLQTETPLTLEDRFEIGSITKTFVATIILQLVEEGKIGLDDPITDRLSVEVLANIPNFEKITIRQLLNHTSGIADYTLPLFFQAQTNPGVFLQDWQPEELLTFITNQNPYFAPGESWEYSNTNVILLGLIIEAVTESNMAAEIRSRILEPLELNDTFFAEEEEIPGGYVNAYWDFDGDGNFNDVSGANLSWAWAAGAMVSNPIDLARFISGLLSGQLLAENSLEQMLTFEQPINSDNYDAYGMGIGALESPLRQWYGHRGLTLAHRSNLFYSPTDNIIYIELINSRDLDNISNPLFAIWRAEQQPPTPIPEPGNIWGLLLISIGGFRLIKKFR